MVRKIHHITIAVQDLDAAMPVYREVLGVEPLVKQYDAHNLRWAVFPLGDSEIQLCQNMAPPSDQWPADSVARRYSEFVRDHGEGFHHVALEVDDLNDALSEMHSGHITIAGQPITDAKPFIEPRARLAFLDKAGLNGVSVELIQLTESKPTTGE